MPVRENPLKVFNIATKLIIDTSIISNATQIRKVMSNEDHSHASKLLRRNSVVRAVKRQRDEFFEQLLGTVDSTWSNFVLCQALNLKIFNNVSWQESYMP